LSVSISFSNKSPILFKSFIEETFVASVIATILSILRTFFA